jgi:outer membrane protein OmpA-like peptidoglycan-associated protein
MTSLAILLILMVCSFLLKVYQEKANIDEQQRVKQEIIAQLLKRLGKKYPVVIDPRTGAVTIADQILFGFDQATITPKGKDFLRRFVPEYSAILLAEPRIRAHIGQILVVGYADRRGSFDVNLLRSVERAYAVSTFIFGSMPSFPQRENLRMVLSTNGRGSMEQRSTDDASRRVEFKFQMKDWDLVKAGRFALPTPTPSHPRPGKHHVRLPPR